ncbi:hypothetical protein OA57_03675, partial [Chelonobacter oris]
MKFSLFDKQAIMFRLMRFSFIALGLGYYALPLISQAAPPQQAAQNQAQIATDARQQKRQTERVSAIRQQQVNTPEVRFDTT